MRSGSLVAMQGILSAIGKDCLMFIDARELPLPQEYRFLPLDGLVSEPPEDLEKRTIVFLDCGNIDRNPGGRVPPSRRAHPQYRSSPRQHPLRDRQPGRPRGLLHRRDPLGSDERARRRPIADGGRCAVRGPDHRHRPLHVREHRAPGAPDGGRSDRRRGQRTRHLPAGLRGRSVRQAGAAGARPGECASATTTAA